MIINLCVDCNLLYYASKLTPPIVKITTQNSVQDLTNPYLPSLPNNQRSLTFIGTPIRESKRLCNDGSWITEIQLINVYSLEGHIHFDFYWVPKSLLFKSKSDKLSFKALPQISPAEQLLLFPLKAQSQTNQEMRINI